MSVAKANTGEVVQRVLSEDVLTLKQAAVEIKNLTGQKPDRATLHRWVLRGVGGVKLEACRIGPTWVTSMQAMNRFIVARTEKSLS